MIQIKDIHLMGNNPWLNLLWNDLPAQEIDSDRIFFQKNLDGLTVKPIAVFEVSKHPQQVHPLRQSFCLF